MSEEKGMYINEVECINVCIFIKDQVNKKGSFTITRGDDMDQVLERLL